MLSVLHSPLTSQYFNIPSPVFFFLETETETETERKGEIRIISTTKFSLSFKRMLSLKTKAKKGLPKSYLVVT